MDILCHKRNVTETDHFVLDKYMYLNSLVCPLSLQTVIYAQNNSIIATVY